MHTYIKCVLIQAEQSWPQTSNVWHWHLLLDLYILLSVPTAFFPPFSTPLCYFAAESFTPDSICCLAATVVPIHTAAPAWAKPSIGTRPANFSSSSIHKNKKKKGRYFLWWSPEAPHFHLGTKWFGKVLIFFCFNVKRLKSDSKNCLFFAFSRNCLLKGFDSSL